MKDAFLVSEKREGDRSKAKNSRERKNQRINQKIRTKTAGPSIFFLGRNWSTYSRPCLFFDFFHVPADQGLKPSSRIASPTRKIEPVTTTSPPAPASV